MQNIRERARIRWHLVEIGHGWLCEVLICRVVDKQGKDLVELARNLGEVEDGDVEADLADRACVHLMRDLPDQAVQDGGEPGSFAQVRELCVARWRWQGRDVELGDQLAQHGLDNLQAIKSCLKTFAPSSQFVQK